VAAGIGQLAAIQTMALSSGMELSAIDPTDTGGNRASFRGIRTAAEWRRDRYGKPVAIAHRELTIS